MQGCKPMDATFYSNIEGDPRVQTNSSKGTRSKTAPNEPKAFWHIRQWQISVVARGPLKP